MIEDLSSEPAVSPPPIIYPQSGVGISVPAAPPKKSLAKSCCAVLAIVFLLIILATVVGGYLVYRRWFKTEIPNWTGLKPGVATEAEVVATLGNPLKKQEEELGTLLFYQSDLAVFPNTVVLDKDGVVSSMFVQVPLEKPLKFSDWKRKYGSFDKEMSNSYLEFSRTYIFPRQGVAVVANADFDRIYAIHYFSPTSLTNYLAQWRDYFFEENPYEL